MSNGTRRLAAILFTDLAGFTAATQANEAASLALLREEEALVRPILAPFGGRQVKSTGDGALIEFGSALKATECAVEIQRRLHERNAHSRGPPIALRVGLHVGDVEETDGDIFGDAVNVASRIVTTAEPGGVCLSEQVFDHVHHKLPYNLVRLPHQKLRGLSDPIEIYRVVLPWTVPDGRKSAVTIPRLAVLPLASISPDPKDEYLADGLTEELISVLSQIRGLRVISRTSVNQFKGSSKSIAQIGSELGVGSVLEGSVRRAGEHLRITVQLIDVETDEHQWAHTYDRKLDNVFAIQAEVAEHTATALRLELIDSARDAIQRGPTSDLGAYDLYLKGLAAQRRLYADFSPIALTEARTCFEGAIQRDPHFSLAYSQLANCLIAVAGSMASGREVFPQAHALATRALELDPGSSEAHIARGNLALQAEGDWNLAEAELRDGIARNPNTASGRGWYGIFLTTLQRFDEAREQIRLFGELEPLDEAARRLTFSVFHLSGAQADLLAYAKETLRVFPNDALPHLYLGMDWADRGKMEEARAEFDLARGVTGFMGLVRTAALPRIGRASETRSVLEERERTAAQKYVPMTWLAALHAALGEKEEALAWLERDAREGDDSLWFDYQWDHFDPVRDDPRFVEMLRAANLPTGLKRPRTST